MDAGQFVRALCAFVKVLGVAYDQPRRLFYVLDVDDDDQVTILNQVQRRARLHRLDIGTGQSALLGTWPYAEVFELVRMAAMEDGQLAVITASATSYAVTRLQPQQQTLLVTGVFLGLGTVIDQPMMGEHNLILPVALAGKFTYVELSPNRFFPGSIWPSL